MENESKQDEEVVSLLTEHQTAIRFYISSLLPGEARAADVAQQANITIWNKRDDFEPGTNFKAWAFSIARYEVLNFRKKEARDARLQFSDELEEIISGEISSHVDDIDERHEALRECMQKLKQSDRDLIHHRYFETTSLADYAQQVGRSAAGLKVSLHRLRSGLAKCIEKRVGRKGARA
ncbi:MAG: sigma-70 family RNA polymerase sigma factor [Verrucomicrobiales bacterium]|nr:sigma-70 family RNA polymerase sigma factor [Verrucomicrobiales bacterium]